MRARLPQPLKLAVELGQWRDNVALAVRLRSERCLLWPSTKRQLQLQLICIRRAVARLSVGKTFNNRTTTRSPRPMSVKSNRYSAAVAALTIALGVTSPLTKADAAEDPVQIRRLKIAWQQPVLTQRMAKAACLAHLGVRADTHLTQLETAQNLFEMRLDALTRGSRRIAIPAPRFAAHVQTITQVRQLWQDVRTAVDGMLQGAARAGGAGTHVRFLYQYSLPMLDATRAVVFALESTTRLDATERDPALAGAILVARRQRMLSEKLVKEVCLVALGLDAQRNRAQILGSLALFDSARGDLERSLGKLQLSPKHVAQIRTHDRAIAKTFSDIKSLVQPIQSGAAATTAALSQITQLSDTLLIQLNASLDAYERAQQVKVGQGK